MNAGNGRGESISQKHLSACQERRDLLEVLKIAQAQKNFYNGEEERIPALGL